MARWKLAGGEQYTTNQCSHKKNPELPFHAVLSTPGVTLSFNSFAMPDLVKYFQKQLLWKIL
jgi:hypothetical protein